MSAVVPLAVIAALYAGAALRLRAARPGDLRVRNVWAFLGGLAALGASVTGPVDAAAASSFSWHMVQHLLVALVAAPLLLLGRPLLLLRRTGSRTGRAVATVLRSRTVHAVTHPVVVWSGFMATMWATHHTPLYQLALDHAGIHVLEHALYLGTALLFWFPVLAVEPSPWRLGHGARLLYLFLAAPANALLASSIFQADAPLYARYASNPAALADQRSAAAIMWIGGGLLMLAAVLLVAASWARAEHAAARRRDVVASSPPGA